MSERLRERYGPVALVTGASEGIGRAVLAPTHALAPRLIARGRGVIVLLSSLVAFQGVPRAAHDAATKA